MDPAWAAHEIPHQDLIKAGLEDITDKETHFRRRQVTDCLEEVRYNLRVKNGVWKYKRDQVEGAGQKPVRRVYSPALGSGFSGTS